MSDGIISDLRSLTSHLSLATECSMSGDVLSQAEVESLLSAMDSRESDVIADAATSRIKHRDKISPYDFKRPERVGKEQMRSLQTMHEAFGRNFGASLSALLADDRRAEAHERRSAHLQRIRLQPRKPDLLQPDQRRAAGRPVDSRHQPVAPVPDHRSAAGRRQRSGHRRPPAAHRNRAAARFADHRSVLQRNEARLGKRART